MSFEYLVLSKRHPGVLLLKLEIYCFVCNASLDKASNPRSSDPQVAENKLNTALHLICAELRELAYEDQAYVTARGLWGFTPPTKIIFLP